MKRMATSQMAALVGAHSSTLRSTPPSTDSKDTMVDVLPVPAPEAQQRLLSLLPSGLHLVHHSQHTLAGINCVPAGKSLQTCGTLLARHVSLTAGTTLSA